MLGEMNEVAEAAFLKFITDEGFLDMPIQEKLMCKRFFMAGWIAGR